MLVPGVVTWQFYKETYSIKVSQIEKLGICGLDSRVGKCHACLLS